VTITATILYPGAAITINAVVDYPNLFGTTVVDDVTGDTVVDDSTGDTVVSD